MSDAKEQDKSLIHKAAMVIIPGLILLGIGQTYDVKSAIDVLNVRAEATNENLKAIREDVKRLEKRSEDRWTNKDHKEYAEEVERRLSEIRAAARDIERKLAEIRARVRELEKRDK